MADPVPQENSATPPVPLPDSTAGPDLSGLRTQQIQPAPESIWQTVKRNITPEKDSSRAAYGPGHQLDPGDSPAQEGEQAYREKFGSPLEQFYGRAKKLISEHESKLSEKYLAPFRSGLDNMASDLEQAGETGRTKSGGALNPVTRGLAAASGAALRMVPVGKDVKETAEMAIVPPELGPEGKALSKEIKAGERVAETAAPDLAGLRTREVVPAPKPSASKSWEIHDLGKDHNIASDEGYLYHATNHDRASDIAESGGLDTHKPSYGTDQETWPDGTTEKRSYFTKQADQAWQFSPEEGKPALLRMKQDPAIHSRESTGDFYSKKKIPANKIEVFGDDKQWHPISELSEAKPAPKSPDLAGLRTREVSPPATAGKSKVVSPAKETPKPPQHEPVGIHEDDVPRGSKTPDVDWNEQDLQDSAKAVSEQTIAKDYGPKRKGAKFSVYKAHIPMEDLPSAKIVEEEDPEFEGSDWRENYQGLLRSTTPPIKVRVNPKGEMEILDGNHRAQLWSDANMTHAPAWVIDERGKGIENLSEDEKAERAEAEEEEQAAKNETSTSAQPQTLDKESVAQHIVKTSPASAGITPASAKKMLQADSYELKEIPVDSVKRSVSLPNEVSREYADRKTPIPPIVLDSKSGVVDGNHRLTAAKIRGQETISAYVPKSGQAANKADSILKPEGAQPLADKLGAKVVGSVAKKESERTPNAYGSTKPRDLDLRIEGEYKPDEILPKLKAEGFEPRGSSLVSPEEAKKSGKRYGKPGWKRAEHFENAAGEKLDVWHDEAEQESGSQTDKLIQHVNKNDWYHVPPAEGESAYSKRGQFFASNYKDAEFYGRPLDEPQNPQIKKPLVGDETAIAKELGIPPQKEGMSREEIAEHDKQWGSAAKQKGYGSIVLMSPEKWKESQSTGKIPSSLELQHLEKLEAAPKNPQHEKLFSEAVAAIGPGTEKAAAKTKINASGESAASQEAINRASSEKAAGTKRVRIDTRSGRETPIIGTEAVDAKAGPYDVIVQRSPGKPEILLDSGRTARPYRPKN
jgi:hypothetical protein